MLRLVLLTLAALALGPLGVASSASGSHGRPGRLARHRRSPSHRNLTSEHSSSRAASSVRPSGSASSSRSRSSAAGRSGDAQAVVKCAVKLSDGDAKRWRDSNARAIRACAERAAQAKDGLVVCHSTAYVDRNRKTFGGAVHVVQSGKMDRNAGYAVSLSSKASGLELESDVFATRSFPPECDNCSSDDLSSPDFSRGRAQLLASLHYNGALTADSDLRPDAVVLAAKGSPSGGTAKFVQLGKMDNATEAWGLFTGLPDARRPIRRRAREDSCEASDDDESEEDDDDDDNDEQRGMSSSRSSQRKSESSRSSKSKSSSRSSKTSDSSRKSSSERGSRKSGSSRSRDVGIFSDTICQVIEIQSVQRNGNDKNLTSTSSAAESRSTANKVEASQTAAVVQNNGGDGAQVVATGSVANSRAVAAAEATPTPSPSPAAAAAGGGDAQPTPVVAGADATTTSSDSTGTVAAEQVSQSAFQLPGRSIAVLPIGLSVFAGVSVLALAIVGFVTYERRKYRKQFRARKLAQQVQATSYGTGQRMSEARI